MNGDKSVAATRRSKPGEIMSKSKVAVLFTTPKTVLADYQRLMEMAGVDKILDPTVPRSEERRVGKECRSRWSPYH